MTNKPRAFGLKKLLKIEINKYNVFSLALLGSFGHPLFWFIWTRIDPQPYENLPLRALGSIMCIILFSLPYWKKSFEKFSYFYWTFAILYNLPFFFTVNVINNNFNSTWLTCEIIALMVVFFSIENIISSFLIIIFGAILGVLFCLLFYPDNNFYETWPIRMVPVLLFAISTAIIFSYSNIKGVLMRKDAVHRRMVTTLKSIAGSIAHELRNPLNSIKLVDNQIEELLSKIDKFDDNTKTQLLELTSQISKAIHGANNIINMILGDLSEETISSSDFQYLAPAKILPEIVDKYGYSNFHEKKKVILDPSLEQSEILLKTVPDRLSFIIYNLLKNSLYYLGTNPNLTVKIGIEEKNFQGQNYNAIYIQDNGPGIPKEIIPKLFNDFYTSGKKGGTGLGLAFCRRNMLAFGGEMICESELGKWTKFYLLFPKISEEELRTAQHKIEVSRKKILIIDDEKTNLLITKSKIEQNLKLTCDIAHDSVETLDLIQNQKESYELILMDIQMPEMDGVTLTKKIKSLKISTPIVALTSLDYESLPQASHQYFNYYLSKPASDCILYRTVSKFICDLDDKLDYIDNEEQCHGELKGKKILFAEDQELNLKITTKKLTNLGAEVIQARNGAELVNIYQENLKSGLKFDLIITDINMPIMNGDEATTKIREIEAQSKTLNADIIPIIALTGDNDKKNIQHFLATQITDYFTKGDDPEKLIKIVALYLNPAKTYSNQPLTKSDLVKKTKLQNLNIDKLGHFSNSEKKEFLEIFLEESRACLEEISQNLKDGKLSELSKHLHALKGISGNIGAEILYHNVKQIEQNLKSFGDLFDVTWLTKLHDDYKFLEIEIHNLLQSF